MSRFCQFITGNPLFFPAVAVIGCVSAVYSSIFYIFVSIVAVIVLIIFHRWRELLLCLVICFLGLGLSVGEKRDYERQDDYFSEIRGGPITIEGSVERVFDHSVWVKKEGASVRHEVVLSGNRKIKPGLGEKWRFTGVVSGAYAVGMDGLFDRGKWLRRNKVAGRVVATKGDYIGEGGVWGRVLGYSLLCRNAVSGILGEGANDGNKAVMVMRSILLGDKSGMDYDIYENFRTSGSLHIFAVSGLHVGIVSFLILGVLILFRMHPVNARLATLPLLAGYVYITGMPVSAVRAFVMISLIFVAMNLRRRIHAVNILSATVILFLLWNPIQVLAPGFQLSFGIFAVIFTVAMWQGRRLPLWEPDPFIPKNIYTFSEKSGVKVEKWLRYTVVLSIFCWLAALPITAVHFKTLNLYSALTNILMTPFLPLIMIGCLLSVIFAWSSYCVLVLNYISRCLAEVLLFISGGISALPSAIVPVAGPASSDSYMLISHLDGTCSVVLGNPGLLINGGSRENIRYTVVPGLFTQGFAPKAHLLTKPQKKLKEGAEELSIMRPGIRQLGIVPLTLKPFVFPCQGGDITIYSPQQALKYGIMDDYSPVVKWNCQQGSILYIGDSSYNYVSQLPEDVIRADVVIIGKHSKDPVESMELINKTHAKKIIFCNTYPEGITSHLDCSTSAYLLRRGEILKDSLTRVVKIQ